MPKFLIIGLLVLLSFAGYAGNVKPKAIVKHAPLVLHTDTSRVQVRTFNSDALQKYAKDNDFKYDEGAIGGESWWSRFWHWLWGLITRLFSSKWSGGNIFFKIVQYLFYGAAIGFIIWAIFKIVGIDVVRLFKGRAKTVEIPYEESLENIHEINFDDEIEKAISNLNYRLAVRLLYLRSLKQLSDAQLIHWQIEKTNSAYLNELANPEQKQSFGLLTRQFEYIWYGDFFIDSSSFQNINGLFHDFKRMVA